METTMRKITFVALVTLLSAAAPFTTICAQTAPADAHHPGATPAASPMMADMMAKMMADHTNMMMLKHTEGYLASLRAELQITDAQSGPWTAYADTVRAIAKKTRAVMPMPPMAGMPPAAGAPATPEMPAMPKNWPDKLAANENALTGQLDALKAIRPSVVALYSVLTPEQKKIADELGAGAKGMM
jgi:hypothetical protein